MKIRDAYRTIGDIWITSGLHKSKRTCMLPGGESVTEESYVDCDVGLAEEDVEVRGFFVLFAV